ncbi:MAG: hypothetical protein JNK49_02235 [Planctomycetes bacterium]|nr:hypothetical protein [Planctomycetota bacterium]
MRCLLLACLTTSLCAQAAPCFAGNDSSTSVTTSISGYGFTAPNVFAYQFQAPSTGVVLAGQLYTGNVNLTPGFETLELWDHDPTTNAPGFRLGGGTWQIAPGLGVTWQGCNFDQTVPVIQGNDYWLVWTDPGSSRLPYEPGGFTLPMMRRSGVNWLVGTPQPLKYRLFCNYLESAAVSNLGTACAATNGRIGVAFTNEVPNLGNAAFKIEGSGFAPGALAVLAVGWDPNWSAVPIPGAALGCTQNTDLLNATFGLAGTGTVRSNTTVGAAGHVRFPFAIPASPGLVGLFLSTQLAGLDAGSTAAIPFSFSNAVRFVVQ